MAAFDPSVYLGQESNEIAGQFLTLKKDDLKALGKHLNLDVKAAMKKAVIQKIIADHLMSENIVEKGSIEIPVVVSHVDAELRKLELQLELKRITDKDSQELELKRLELAAEENARKNREELRRLELAAEEKARKDREELRKLELAAEDRARQEKIAAEDRARKEKLDAEERARREKLVQEKEIELARLAHSRDIAAMQSDAGQAISSMSPLGQAQSHAHFNIAQWFQTVPKFRENAVEDFFVSFEKMADRLKWPTEYWTALLQHVLVGKGLEVFNQLGIAESANFEYVKEAILKAYQKVPEAYRQKFRNYTKASSQTYTEFAHAKQRYFDKWCHAMKVQQDFERLRLIILIEEFKESVNFNLRVYIDERAPTNLNEAAHLADEYALIHQSQFHSKSHSNSSKSSNNSSSSCQSNGSDVEKQTSVSPSVDSKQNSSSKSSSSTPQSFVSSSVTCNYCKGQGHVVSECLKLQRKHGQQSYESQPKGFVGHVVSVVPSAPIRVPTVSDDSVSAVEVIEKPLSVDGVAMGNLEPFVSDGFVSLSSDFVDATPIRILRDTGASHSLLLVDVLPFSSSSYSGTNVLIMGVDSDDFVSVPLHNIHLLSRLVSGPVTVGVRSSLPHKGIQFILGNDLAGEKVIADPYLPTRSCVDQPVDSVDPVEQKFPGRYSACAVTHAGDRKKEEKEKKTLKNNHAISKKACDVSNDEIDLSETFVGQEMSDSILPSNSQDTSQDTSSLDLSDPKLQSDLINKQRAANTDTTLLFQKAVTPEEAALEPICFYLKNGVLMRKFRPPHMPADEDWPEQHQIVLPSSYRPEVLRIAHETPLSGHLSVSKTYLKLLKNFYWPTMKRDVVRFCQSCHICQNVWSPNNTISDTQAHNVSTLKPSHASLSDSAHPISTLQGDMQSDSDTDLQSDIDEQCDSDTDVQSDSVAQSDIDKRSDNDMQSDVDAENMDTPLISFKERLLSHDSPSMNLLPFDADTERRHKKMCDLAEKKLKDNHDSLETRNIQQTLPEAFIPGVT